MSVNVEPAMLIISKCSFEITDSKLYCKGVSSLKMSEDREEFFFI